MPSPLGEFTPPLRPFKSGEFVDNGDGTRSTERLRTVPMPDGSWANVPSLWMGDDGQPFDFGADEDSISAYADLVERMVGKKFPRFRNAEEGIAAAKKRSDGGGAFQGSILGD